MHLRFALHWQIALVVVLFAAALTVLFSALGAIRLPERERQAQEQLTQAGQRMAEVAASLLDELPTMPNGGALRCRTRRLEGPPRLELSVADTGLGIAANDLPHLFEPFHTTRQDGTGLGLALCREIVQQHGGRIELIHEQG